MSKALILYIPVVHRGYLELLEKNNKVIQKLYILGDDIVSSVSKYKEIRSLPPLFTKKLIEGLGFSFKVQVLTKNKISKISVKEIFSASDAISKKFIRKYFPKRKVNYTSVFLSWDEKAVISPIPPAYDTESFSKFDKKIMHLTRTVGGKSSDWWRRVGVLVVKNKKIIARAHNHYLPSENTPYIDGNPRDFIKAGTLGFLSSSVHAEQAVISEAARLGKSLRGTDLYINSYPCPTCAKLMGIAGIKRCFFSGGNAYLRVDEVFKAVGIKTILVK